MAESIYVFRSGSLPFVRRIPVCRSTFIQTKTLSSENGQIVPVVNLGTRGPGKGLVTKSITQIKSPGIKAPRPDIRTQPDRTDPQTSWVNDGIGTGGPSWNLGRSDSPGPTRPHGSDLGKVSSLLRQYKGSTTEGSDEERRDSRWSGRRSTPPRRPTCPVSVQVPGTNTRRGQPVPRGQGEVHGTPCTGGPVSFLFLLVGWRSRTRSVPLPGRVWKSRKRVPVTIRRRKTPQSWVCPQYLHTRI